MSRVQSKSRESRVKVESKNSRVESKKWRGTGGREPGRIGAGGGREAGGDGAGYGSHLRAGSGRRMRDIKYFNDFLVPF